VEKDEEARGVLGHVIKGADVFTARGEKIGTFKRVVIDARTRDVADLVVDRGPLNPEKVIPGRKTHWQCGTGRHRF